MASTTPYHLHGSSQNPMTLPCVLFRNKTVNHFSSELKYNLQVLAFQVELVCIECRGEGALAQTLVQEQVPQ